MIFLGADHRGFKVKEAVKEFLKEKGLKFKDLGNKILDPKDDFPDFAALVAEKVSQGKGLGIVSCGSGGMALVANKFYNVRAVEAWNEETARHAKEHDNANILMIAADFVDKKSVRKMVEVWLETPLAKGKKYRRRLEKIKLIERRNFYAKNSN